MAKNLSYDITLGSDDYILARDKNGTPQIQLGSSPSEPGFKSQIGSIKINRLDDDYGVLVDESTQCSADVNGIINLNNSLYSAGAVVNTVTTGLTGLNEDIFPKTFCRVGSHLFLITALAILLVNQSTGAVTSKLTTSSPNRYTGSWVKYGDYVYFGRSNSAGVSLACGRWQISLGLSAGFDNLGPLASYFFSFGNKIWYVANKATGTPHEVYWTDADTWTSPNWTYTAPRTGAGARGPYYIETTHKVTWLSGIGSYLIYFLDDSTFNTIDQDGVFAPLSSDEFSISPDEDWSFGHPCEQFMGGLLVPHEKGLLFLRDINTFEDISPHSFDNLIYEGVACVDTYGDNIVALTRNNGWSLLYKKYGKPWQLLDSSRTYIPSSDDCYAVACKLMPSWAASNRLSLWIYAAAPQPTSQNGILTEVSLNIPDSSLNNIYIKDTSFIKTPFYTGDSISAPFAGMVTKRFVRARMYTRNVDSYGSVSSPYIKLSYLLDGDIISGSYTSITPTDPMSTSGGFSVATFPNTSASLGRAVSLKIELYNPVGTAQLSPVIHLPIYIDFEYVPSANDIIMLPIVAGIDEYKSNNAHRKKHTVEKVMTAIQGLLNTVVTLKIMQGGQTWTVLVEDYNMSTTADNIILNEGEAVISVRCRRLA